MNQKRLYHIDGIKGILCFFIMFGHFWNLTLWNNPESPLVNKVTTFINNSIFCDTLFSATFWMYAFLLISGYLLSGSKVNNLLDLGVKIVKRYLRFFLLIFASCVFIFGIYKTVGFHNAKTSEFFINGWYQSYYTWEFGLKSILTETVNALFYSGCGFNAPFWVMSDILFSSVIIYVCKYVEKYTKKASWVCLVASAFFNRPVISACLAGYVLGSYKEQAKKWPVIAMFLVGSICAGLLHREYLFYILLYCFVLALVDRLEFVQKFFGMKFFRFTGQISFGVYAFHWPIICSVGSLALICGRKKGFSGMVAYVLALVVSVIAVTIISTVYYFVIEKQMDKLLKKYIKWSV
jgi:peptidoglycan/LPS O-acetylase OafA/YrhL